MRSYQKNNKESIIDKLLTLKIIKEGRIYQSAQRRQKQKVLKEAPRTFQKVEESIEGKQKAI